MAKRKLRDMIVLLPGITGSVLQKDGRDVWAVSGQAAWRALTTLGTSLDDLHLNGDDPGGIVATRVMPDAHLVPGLVKIDGYSKLARMITNAFDIVEGSAHDDRPANFIQFPYDWRLDNRVNAQQLGAVLQHRLRLWREYSKIWDARVILVAHSMGGLLARYYLEVLEGWRDCRALITFGTPYRGALNSLDFLSNGYRQLFMDLTQVMRSFPSVHQLLPIYRALLVNKDYVRVAETDGVPGVVPALARDALKFHREIEAKVKENHRDRDYIKNGYVTMPIVGTRQPTKQSAILSDGRVVVGCDVPTWMDPILAEGDGTVPRASAIPMEMSDDYRATFTAERHGSLQCNPFILDDLQGRLEQLEVQGLREVRAPQESFAAERPGLSLDLDDLYFANEPVQIHARVVNATQQLSPPLAYIEPVDPPNPLEAQMLEFAETASGWILVMDRLPPGLYRVEARPAKGGHGAPPAVHDLFEVAGARR
jgi:pimeloyl-ACP methyl ester carboxylesterase